MPVIFSSSYFPLFWCFSFPSVTSIEFSTAPETAPKQCFLSRTPSIVYHATWQKLRNLRRTVSVTLTVLRAIQENFVTYFLQHWRSNDHIWQFRKTSSDAFCDTDDPTTVYGRFEILQELLCYTRTCKVWCLFPSSYAFRDTDDPTTIYGRFGILQGTFVSHKNL